MKKEILRTATGFTLIELIVVIFIIGIVSAAIIFHAGDRDDERERHVFADQLMSRIQMIHDESISQMKTLALIINESYYEFYQFQEKPAPQWIPLRLLDSFWQKYKIPHTITIEQVIISKSSSSEHDATVNNQPLVFSPAGDNTSYIISISSHSDSHKLVIIGKSDGQTLLQETQ